MGEVPFLKNEVSAVVKYLHISPVKVRRILRCIQGRSYFEALSFLKFLPYKGCDLVIKVLQSAVSNAVENNQLEKSRLRIKSVFVDQGAALKRLRCRAKGKADRILKRTSTITIILEEKF
jgi:large subunit ribosomal protein L22